MMPSHLTPTMETGTAGLFRLFNQQLAGQVSWFFPIIFLGLFLWFRNFKFLPAATSLRKAQIFLWLGWLFPLVLYFSFTGGLFHRYYLSI